QAIGVLRIDGERRLRPRLVGGGLSDAHVLSRKDPLLYEKLGPNVWPAHDVSLSTASREARARRRDFFRRYRRNAVKVPSREPSSERESRILRGRESVGRAASSSPRPRGPRRMWPPRESAARIGRARACRPRARA